VLSGGTILCFLTVIVGCWAFLILAGKLNEHHESERRIIQWEEERKAEQRLRQQAQAQANASSPPRVWN